MNAGRTANKRRGVALYEQLGPGYPLPGDCRPSSLGTPSRVLSGPRPNYMILKINLGAYEAGICQIAMIRLVGVKDGVVQWRALAYSRAAPGLPTNARH